MTPREINDRLRTNLDLAEGSGNELWITSRANELVGDAFDYLLVQFARFDSWDPDFDPEGHHDMGEIPFGEGTIIFKIEPLDAGHTRNRVTFMTPDDL